MPLTTVVNSTPSGVASTPWILTITPGTLRSDFTGCVGHKFLTGGSGFTVTSLGRWKIAGNSGTHLLRLMDGASSVIASGTVDLSTGSAGGYVYISVTPVVLSANTDYYLFSAELNGGDQFYDDDTLIATTTAVATKRDSQFENVCGVDLNSGPGGVGHAYVPLNILYHL